MVLLILVTGFGCGLDETTESPSEVDDVCVEVWELEVYKCGRQ